MFTKRDSPYIFVAPFVVMFLVFWVWPIVQSMLWSFDNWDGITPPRFVALSNYIHLFRDPDFIMSLENTIIAGIAYIVVLLLLTVVIGFMLNSRHLVARPFFRSTFFIPVTVSLPVVALIFTIIYSPNNGILDRIIRLAGFRESVDWLGNPDTALWSIVALRLWRAAGYYSIFVIAGLQAIPRETVEASYIDGAGYLQSTLRVVLPQLKPILIYIVIASSVWAFQLFEEPWIMTAGGPDNATSTVGIFIYRTGFKYFTLGYASAGAYFLALVILAFALLQLTISREK